MSVPWDGDSWEAPHWDGGTWVDAEGVPINLEGGGSNIDGGHSSSTYPIGQNIDGGTP
jgi:hypothetical protein